MKKIVDGILVDLTADEISARQAEETAWNNNSFDRALANLRDMRNSLLKETDYLALSDHTLTDKMKKYRQDLRDITNGLETVEQVKAVEFPTKP